MKIIDFLDRGAAISQDGLCLHDDTHGYSYRETVKLTNKIAYALRANGLTPGKKVAVYSPNDVEGFVAVLGIHRSDCIWIVINARNTVADNIALLNRYEAEWLFYHSDIEQHLPAIAAAVPSLKGHVCVDRRTEHSPALLQWCEPHSDAPIPSGTNYLSPIRIASTGGTTGAPRGVVQSNLTLQTVVSNISAHMPYDEPPRYLCASPMTHAGGGVCYTILAFGGSVFMMKKPDPLAVMECIERHRIVSTLLPPTLIYMILAHPRVRDFDYSSLKYLIYGASPMSTSKLREAMQVFGPVMCQLYGQTEAAMSMAFMSAADHAEAVSSLKKSKRLESCGRPTMHTMVEVMDDNGNLLGPNEIGEIVVRSNIVMMEYYNDPEATRESRLFGWHHTSDLGYKDEDGFVYLVDRKKDMIITGGFNIYPSEVERVILMRAEVLDCAVIGVPDDKWGEALKAIVQLKPGTALDTDELLATVKAQLGSVKTPKSVEIWPDLPKSAVGKVLKREIRGKFWQGHERKI
ncbi:AMP-binding protein [Pseudorhodoplanes sp.]|uniref:AMP-binding protein n=1 Tax=Pseudorhodoplanes sp. TaxID=1934341 RepID=UPI003D09875C